MATTDTQHKLIVLEDVHISMPQVALEPAIPVFEQSKVVRALDDTTTLIFVSYVDNRPSRPSGRRLLAKLVPTFADRGCHVVRATDPRGC
jgi:hypothetical protein